MIVVRRLHELVNLHHCDCIRAQWFIYQSKRRMEKKKINVKQHNASSKKKKQFTKPKQICQRYRLHRIQKKTKHIRCHEHKHQPPDTIFHWWYPIAFGSHLYYFSICSNVISFGFLSVSDAIMHLIDWIDAVTVFVFAFLNLNRSIFANKPQTSVLVFLDHILFTLCF